MEMMFMIPIISLLIPVCIGAYVYRDAKERGMTPVLWAMVAVLLPGFTGLIIYLIARTRYSVLRCARCGAVVDESYAVCLQCGISLQAGCPSCGRTVSPEWKVCAYCGETLPSNLERNIVEPPSIGKTLWIMCGIAVVFVLLVLFVLASNLVWYWVPHGMNVIHHMI